MASPICLLAVYYYKADSSVMKNKRFLSFKEGNIISALGLQTEMEDFKFFSNS